MQNPFRYGAVAMGEFFTNREEELRILEADVLGGQDVVVISPRRLGKTSLVLQLAGRLRSRGTLVAYVDLLNTPTKDRLVRHLADALFRSLETPANQALKTARDLFSHLTIKPTVTVGEDGKPALELVPASRPGDLDDDLQRLLELPQRVAARRGKRVVLVIDEFQEIVSIAPSLLGPMRSAFQQQPDVAHVYLGSKYHLMNHVFNDANQPFYRSAKPLPLEPIAGAAFAAFIRSRFLGTGIRISEEVTAYLLGVTGCHPNDTQELCYFIWSQALAEGEEPTVGTVDRALEQILAAENARYTVVWEDLAPSQRVLLLALSREPSQGFAEEYRRRHGLSSAATVQRARERLKDRELIELRADGKFHVPDVFLRRWLGARET